MLPARCRQNRPQKTWFFMHESDSAVQGDTGTHKRCVCTKALFKNTCASTPAAPIRGALRSGLCSRGRQNLLKRKRLQSPVGLPEDGNAGLEGISPPSRLVAAARPEQTEKGRLFRFPEALRRRPTGNRFPVTRSTAAGMRISRRLCSPEPRERSGPGSADRARWTSC